MDDLFGCTFPEFIRHIISKLKDGMEFNNRKDWHIDHIVPVSNFDLTDAEQVKQAYHYSNLEPIWAKENRTKARKHRVIPSN
jgi:CRISPR/Cas system endoribonuclease Cas6 (RAMP superfamily)